MSRAGEGEAVGGRVEEEEKVLKDGYNWKRRDGNRAGVMDPNGSRFFVASGQYGCCPEPSCQA